MTRKIDGLAPHSSTGPTVPPSPSSELKASLPTDASGLRAATERGRQLAALDPNSFPGFRIIKVDGKEWIVS